MTISRSRKHITSYYGDKRVGQFPEKNKPDTYNSDINTKKELLHFRETNELLEALILSVYIRLQDTSRKKANIYSGVYIIIMADIICRVEDWQMNDIVNNVNNDIMGKFHKTENILNDIQNIIEVSQKEAYRAVNTILSQRNWLIGYRIAEEELVGKERAEYGLEIIKKLSKDLTKKYGRGLTKTNLYSFYRFYKCFPEIFHTVCGKSHKMLSWSHYRTLLQVHDETARKWYEKEAYEQTWSVRTLQRNIDTQYYYRLLQSQDKTAVIREMQQKTYEYQNDKLEFIKNPVMVEFLGLTPDASFTETKLEASIITNLQKFLMEMGKGYAFVARQQHIHNEKQDYYIDLVFYNYILKCFVLIDLKTDRITHQDVGQMDMYIRMYDELKKSPDDNPTLGIVLCSETDEDIARYSILHGNEQLFASKYKLYLPTEEELREEIETQKAIFYLQQKDAEDEAGGESDV